MFVRDVGTHKGCGRLVTMVANPTMISDLRYICACGFGVSDSEIAFDIFP